MNRNKLCMSVSALAMMILILDSRAAGKAALEGIELCIRSVIPALFPFFLISGYLTGSISGSGFFGTLFHMPRHCGTVILTGLLAGYPVGARLSAQQYRTGMLTKSQADRLLWFCSQAGPSFLFGILTSQMGNTRSVCMLWAIQLLSSLSVAWILPPQTDPLPIQYRFPGSGTDVMTSSLKAMASVCGWIMIFRVIIDFFRRWFLWQLPEVIQILLSGLLELTNGCLMLPQIPDLRLRFLLAAVMLNFGGVCVLMQTHSVTSGLNFRGYLYGKTLQTVFATLYAGVFMGLFWTWIPIAFLFIRLFLRDARKRSSIPVNLGV